MPPMSTTRTFIQALQTKRTNTTKALDLLLARNLSGSQHPQHAFLGSLQAADVSGVLPAWVKLGLTGAGITPGAEMDHIDSWPNKDDIRKAAIVAIEGNRSIKFFWDLHDGHDEENQIDDSGTGDIIITCRTPRRKVRHEGPDSIAVDV